MSNVVEAQAERPRRSAIARLLGVSPLTAAARPHYRDALAELVVGDTLATLGVRWDVLHDVPVGGAVLDHLVIGPSGVYAIDAVMARGIDAIVTGDSVAVGGVVAGVAGTVRQSAAAASSALSSAIGAPVEVSALLVIVEPRRLMIAAPPTDVQVVQSAVLRSTLVDSPAVLTGDAVADISDTADLAGTWSADAPIRQDLPELIGEFNAIRAEVSTALRRRVVLIAAGLILAYVVMVVTVAQLSWLITQG